MAAEETSVPTIDEDEELKSLLMNDEDAWAYFDRAVRWRLGISGDEFLKGVRSGRYVYDDTNLAVTHIFMLMDFVPEDKLEQ
jgi:hypothetical protein